MGLIEILLVVFVLGPLAGAVAHRIQQGGGGGADDDGDPEPGEAIRALEEEIGRLTERVDRLAEEQRFLERLLEERPALNEDDGERNLT